MRRYAHKSAALQNGVHDGWAFWTFLAGARVCVIKQFKRVLSMHSPLEVKVKPQNTRVVVGDLNLLRKGGL